MFNNFKLRLHQTRNKRNDHGWNFYNATLKISLIPFLKMYYYTRAASGEISGLGKIKMINEENPIVTKISIFEQECTGAGTELNYNGALDKFIVELARKNEDPQNWNLWWHSHNDFAVGWSSVDEENIAKFSEDAILFSICINKNGDMIARIDERGNTSELMISILPTGYADLREKCRKEVERRVKVVEFSQDVVTVGNAVPIDVADKQNGFVVIDGKVITLQEMEKQYGLHPTVFYD